jgi:hypothetical protein
VRAAVWGLKASPAWTARSDAALVSTGTALILAGGADKTPYNDVFISFNMGGTRAPRVYTALCTQLPPGLTCLLRCSDLDREAGGSVESASVPRDGRY